MRTLVIETATEACSVGLFEGSDLIAGAWRMLGRGHAENLVPMIAALPDRGRAQRVAVSVGPGSFTGVRVGIATARALGFAWSASVIGYSTLSLIAAMAREQAGSQSVAVAMTGGHGEWFVAGYDADGGVMMEPVSLRPDVAAGKADQQLVAGNQAPALVATRGFGTALEIWPDARSFALLPLDTLQTHAAPIYGRMPDAKVAAP